jgi:Ca2+-binding EF-hand superfamily protein
MEMSQSMTDMDPRLRGERRSDLQKLQELLAERQDGADAVETLEKAKIMGAVDKCEIVSKKEAMVQEAIRSADTDGTGKKINVSVVLQRLSQDLLKEMDDEHLATAREALLDKHRDLVEKTRCVSLAAAPDFIEAHKLRGMLENSPFDLSEDVISSMMRLLDVKDEFVDSVRISEFMRLFCPVLDQTVFTAINAKIIEKYSGLKPAFNALQTNGNVDRAKLAEFLEALPLDPKLQHNEVQDLIKLADADGSGKIELPEFQNIFGTGEMCARTRQQNYKKLQDKNALPPSVRTDSIKSPSKKLASSTLSAEERVKEVILGSRAEELREAFRTVDKEGKGSLDMYALQGAFNKLGLELSEGDMVALVSKLQLSVKAPVDYTSLLTQIRERLSKASSLEEMQAEVVTALHDLLERKGEDKFWLVRAFQILDTETHGGKSRNKFSTAELAKVVGSLRMAASKSLIAQLKELADSERKDGSVNYADFVRMLGESANRLRSAKEGPAAITRRQSSGFIKEASLSGLSVSSIEQLELDDLSEEMEEEIREVIKGKFDTLTNAFRKFDKDGNGNISREEMLDGLKLLQLPISDKQYGKIISRADADGGGSIDFNEFKNAFEISARAVAKREEDKQKKVDEMLRKQRISEAAAASLEPEEEIEAVDPKAESFLWMTLQNRYSSIPLAFAFLKGRTGGKHADVLNEKELCNGMDSHRSTPSHPTPPFPSPFAYFPSPSQSTHQPFLSLPIFCSSLS